MAPYEAGNYSAIPDLYTEDAVIMACGRPRTEGRAALRQSIGKLAAGRKVAIDITERELEVRGDVAWFISDFKVTYTPPDAASPPKVEYGRSMLIYLRGADGRWRIHRDMDSPAPAPAAIDMCAADANWFGPTAKAVPIVLNLLLRCWNGIRSSGSGFS